jgi:hypothetical protein
MEPSSEAKMNLAGCEFPFLVTLKNGVPLEVTPVGFPPSLFRALVGMDSSHVFLFLFMERLAIAPRP